MVPLLNASQLGDYIVGSAVETMETEALIGEFQNVILEDVYGQGKPIEEVMQSVQQQMQQRNVQINTLSVEDIYVPSKEAEFNTNVWACAGSVKSARGKTQMVSIFHSNYIDNSVLIESLRTQQQQPRLKSSFAPAPPTFGAFSAVSSGVSSAFTSGGISSFSTGAAPGGAFAPSSAPAPMWASATPAAYSPPPRPMQYAQQQQQSLYAAQPPPQIAQPQQQSVQLMQQQVDRSQTERVVMQTLMRSAKVGAGGVLTPKGEYAGRAIVQAPQSAPAADVDSPMHDAT